MAVERLTPIGQLLGKTVKYFQKYSRVLFGFVLVFLVIQGLEEVVLAAWGQQSVFGIFGIVFVFAALQVVVGAMLILIFKEKAPVQLSEIKISKDIFWSVLGLYFLVLFIDLGTSLLLIIPAIIFGNWFRFALWELVYSNKRGLRALASSRELVRGYFWPVFWRGFIVTLPFWVVTLLETAGNLWLQNAYFSSALKLGRISFLAFLFTFDYVFMGIIYQELRKIKGENPDSKNTGRKYLIVGIIGYLAWPFFAIFLFGAAVLAMIVTNLNVTRVFQP